MWEQFTQFVDEFISSDRCETPDEDWEDTYRQKYNDCAPDLGELRDAAATGCATGALTGAPGGWIGAGAGCVGGAAIAAGGKMVSDARNIEQCMKEKDAKAEIDWNARAVNFDRTNQKRYTDGYQLLDFDGYNTLVDNGKDPSSILAASHLRELGSNAHMYNNPQIDSGYAFNPVTTKSGPVGSNYDYPESIKHDTPLIFSSASNTFEGNNSSDVCVSNGLGGAVCFDSSGNTSHCSDYSSSTGTCRR